MTAMGAPLQLTRPTRRGQPFTKSDWAWAGLLCLATLAVYLQTGSFGFIYYDDQLYVAANPYVAQGLTWTSVKWAFSSTVVDNWHPLTLLGELAISTLFGTGPRPFHLASAALQAVDVGLLFAFLRCATGRTGPAVAAAALWGLHPLRVESVAWVAELKDVLSGATSLGCLLAYAAYARRRTPARYAAVAGLLALALLSKPTTVPLPFVLLLSDYWPLGQNGVAGTGRWWRARVLEKLPLVAMAAAVAVIAVREQRVLGVLFGIPLSLRLANAAVAVAAYLRCIFVPVGLALFYPHPAYIHHRIGAAATAAALALLLGITAAVLAARHRRPYLPVGWFWFAGMLLPTLGLLQAGEQARADRFTFLPSIGITVAVVWSVADWAGPVPSRQVAAAATAGVLSLALAAGTVRLSRSWRDADALFTRADAVVPDNYLAKMILADQALQRGDLDRAETLATAAIGIAPEASGNGYLTLARVAERRGRLADARRAYDQAVLRNPHNAVVRYDAALFLARQGDDPAAVRTMDRAAALDPANAQAQFALGQLRAETGDDAGAIAAFRRVLVLVPNDPQASGNLGDALRRAGDAPAARDAYTAAVAGGARDPGWESQLAWLTAADGASSARQLAAAVDPAKDACDQAGNREPFPPYAYSLVLARLGRFDDAIAAATAARDAARRTGQPALAAEIDARLRAYRQGSATTLAATAPSR
jgi:tetratricopeptide (TPR) repeat protein